MDEVTNKRLVIATIYLVSEIDAEGKESRYVMLGKPQFCGLMIHPGVVQDAVLITAAVEKLWAQEGEG